jgi:superfamily II DNA or RNA helicase
MKDEISIKPIKLQEYTCKQSKHDIFPKLPLRGILLAPSGSGKTVLLFNLILNVYRDCFERIYIFSPSVQVDQTWQAVKDYQEKIMKVKGTEKKQL